MSSRITAFADGLALAADGREPVAIATVVVYPDGAFATGFDVDPDAKIIALRALDELHQRVEDEVPAPRFRLVALSDVEQSRDRHRPLRIPAAPIPSLDEIDLETEGRAVAGVPEPDLDARGRASESGSAPAVDGRGWDVGRGEARAADDREKHDEEGSG